MKLERLLVATTTAIILFTLFSHGVAQSKTSLPQRQPSLTYEEAMALEDPATRIAALQQILKSRPAHDHANDMREAIVASYAQLGEAQLNENNSEKAVIEFRKALAALPEVITDTFFQETVIRIPLAVSVRGYRNEAVGLARQLETRCSKDGGRLAALGEFFMTIEAPTDAIRALEAAEKLAEPDSRLHRALGAAYRMGLRLDDSIAEYQQAIGADPNDKRAYYELANLYRAHGAFPDAIKLYQKQLEIEPKHAPSFKGLGLTYLALGDESAMTAALNQARDLRGAAEEITGDIYLQTQMAFYYLAQGKLKQARQASETALMIEPRYAWARIAAAEIDMVEGKIFEAERNLLAAQRYAGFPTLFFTFGKLYLSVEDFDGALEQFSKAFSVSAKDQKEIFSARLGGSLDVKSDGLKELLAREHQASIFLPASPTTSEQFKLAESLTRFHAWMEEIKRIASSGKGTVTRKQMEELDRAAMDFVENESSRRAHRALYIAQKLAQAGIATGLAVELAEQSLGLADAATEADGSLRDYPNFDRNGRRQIFRGRALDAKGWAQFRAGQVEESAASLNEAVKAYGSLPEVKRALWHLAVVKETANELSPALDLYLAGYQPPEAGSADVKLAVIEVLYRKVNGSTDGLEARLRQAGITATVAIKPEVAPPAKSSRQTKPQPKTTKGTAAAEDKKLKLESGKADFQIPANLPKSTSTAPAKADVAVETAEVTKSDKDDGLKNEDKTKEEIVSVKPAELPAINVDSDSAIPLTHLFDAATLYSQLETLKPISLIQTPEEETPPPPAKLNTRPRRVSVPVRPKPENQ